MAANEREFTLIGRFDDQITKKLKSISEELNKLNKPLGRDNVTRSLNDGFAAANKELKTLRDQLKEVDKFKMHFDKSGIQAAVEEVKVLGKEINNVSKAGFQFDKSGIIAAQKEASVLGDILKANALIKVGEGVGSAAAAGFAGATGILGRAGQFIASRFNEAVADQLEDIQARGSLFGSLNKEGLFANAKDIKDAEKLRDINDNNYDITRNISRSMEGAIADVVKSSTVSTQTITILSRQLSDNLLPTLLKAKGVTDLSQFGGVEGREKLNKIMEGEKGVGTELAKVYEQMGSITSSPAMAAMTGMGFAQFLGSGSINRQLRIFETNPVLVDALKQGLAKYGNTVEGRIKAVTEGLEIAMPEAALMEARTTIAGGIQSISDNLTNATAGILSMGADIQGQGAKTLEMAKKSGAYARQIEIYDKRYLERKAELSKKGIQSEEAIRAFEEKEKKNRERFLKGLTRLYENADSPIEVIAATFGPLMQSFADMLGSSKNLFIDPVNSIIETLQKPLVQLQSNLENLASEIRSGKTSLAEALGRAIGELFKSFATLFKPESVADQAESALQKMFADFERGFKSVDGEKFMKEVMDGIQRLVMSALFKDGNPLKGLSPLGDLLAKVFALLAAPAFITALISGLVPLALGGMGSLIMGVFKGLAIHMASGATASAAAGTAAGVTGAGVAASGAAVALGLTATIALVMAAFVIFEGPLRALANWMKEAGLQLSTSSNWAMSAAGVLIKGLGDILKGLTDFFTGIWDVLVGMFTGDQERIIRGIKKIFWGIVDTLVGAGESIVGLGGVVVGALGNFMQALANWILGQSPAGQYKPKPGTAPVRGVDSGADRTAPVTTPGSMAGAATAFGSANPFIGSLGEAINFEMKNKPAGSHLVIANSSETIIPAAGGLGARELANTMKTGLQDISFGINESNNIHTINGRNFTDGLYKVSLLVIDNQKQTDRVGEALAKTQQATANSFAQVQEQINQNQSQNEQMFMSLSNQVSKISLMGGMGGDLGMGAGGLGLAASMARTMGLVITSTTGGRHAPGSYHYAGRAIDVGGDSGSMLAYARRLASSSGGRMAELYYTPLGFSIKNGVRVPWTIPNHMDHVHVAYAYGAGNPAMFSKQSDAVAWERKMVPASLRVKSVTTNSGETNFGSATINAPITIYQQPHQDPEQLASMVAIRIGMAVDELRNHA